MAAVKALQQWCRIQCEGYRDVSITNMTTSFRDGLAFCALIHRHRPDLINFDSLKKEDVYDNNKLAFSVAEQHLQIPALLDAEDMVALRVPDRLSILTYVSQYYNYFHGRSPIGGMAGVKRPAESVTEQHAGGKKNAPVSAKVFPSSGPTKENLPPMDHSQPSPVSALKHSLNKQDVPQRPLQTGTLSNKCVVCNQRVHLVQRHLVEGKLYHRNCAKTLTGNPFSADLPKNSSLSRLAPAPDPEKTSPRHAPSWLNHKPSAPSSVSSNTLQPEPANFGPIHTSKFTTPKVSPSPKTSAPSTTNSITPSPQLARSTKTNISNSTTAASSSTPTPAPRTSIAAKNLLAKMKFFSDAEQEKGSSAGTKGTEMVRGQREEHSASHSVTLVVQVGEKDRQKEREKEEKEREMEREREREREKQREKEKERERVKTAREKQRERERVEREEREKEREKERVEREKEREREREEREKEREKEREEREKARERLRVEREREKEREQSQAKASAAMIISKKLTEENNNKPVWSVNQTKQSPAEEPKKEGARGRVKLRANPSLLSDLNLPISEDKRSPSPKTTLTNRRSPSPSPVAHKLRSTSPHPSGAQSESPSDWRARLKPVSKDPSPKSSSQPQSKPWTNGSDLSQSTGPKRPAPAAPAPWITVTAPSVKDSSTPPRDKSTEKDSNKAKTKADYISQEEILRELQQIEESLNDLEKTGVGLELKLRTSEENGEDESVMNELMVEWFTLIKNKQLAMRRESELVYVGRNQELEEEQPTVEQELRRLLDKPEHLKTPMERRREEMLMKKLVEIVNDRNAIVEGLDEDRLREEEEDEQLNQLMMTFNLKKDKSKKKSPMSRLFSWSSKDS